MKCKTFWDYLAESFDNDTPIWRIVAALFTIIILIPIGAVMIVTAILWGAPYLYWRYLVDVKRTKP